MRDTSHDTLNGHYREILTLVAIDDVSLPQVHETYSRPSRQWSARDIRSGELKKSKATGHRHIANICYFVRHPDKSLREMDTFGGLFDDSSLWQCKKFTHRIPSDDLEARLAIGALNKRWIRAGYSNPT